MKNNMLTARKGMQLYFLLLIIAAGYFLHKAIILLPTLGITALQYRFPSLEAFLPISATVGLKHLLYSGEFDPIHPAGLTILLLAITSSLLLKRGFCSHICPIGTISEYVYKGRSFFYKQRIRLPSFLTYLFMTPKYLLLLFLLIAVFMEMQADEIASFIHSPYNIIAEVKMMYFFSEPSLLTVKVLAGLVIFSVLIQNFWCRFLCPYGALLSFFSLFSPISIVRDSQQCISCKTCDNICPSQLTISSAENISSTECTLCQNCILSCPRNSLRISNDFNTRSLSPLQYSWLLIGLFFLGIALASVSGHWNSAQLLSQSWVHYVPMAHMIFH
ncbi:MAG: 4Fe-4S binding protein [Sporomusaceae bacterium]|nr:4Fe-4S binding protein [Sporomusaceae bacterium]